MSTSFSVVATVAAAAAAAATTNFHIFSVIFLWPILIMAQN
jgi:hypothetical protein